MPKPQRFCIFCGGPRLSNEHLFALWLRQIFPRDASSSHIFGQTISAGQPQLQWATQHRQGHSGSRKIKTVCIPCNNEWIGHIDDAAKYVATPLIRGEATVITVPMQNILATWFVKISIVGDSARRGDWNVSKEHRRWMYDHKSPPPNWEVYIGYYTGETWRDLGIFQQGGYLDLTSIGGPGKLTGYAKLTSMGMGNLFAVTIGRQFDMRWDVRGPGATYLRQIWPASGDIQWPTVPVLGDREATAIAHMFPTLRIAKD